MWKGRTDFAGCTTFTNAKAFARYIKQCECHTEPMELNMEHIKENVARIRRNPSLSTAIETRVTHLTSGRLRVQDGALKLLGLRADDIGRQYAKFTMEVERQLYAQGVAWGTASSTGDKAPIVLKPEDLIVHISFVSEHRRVFLVRSRLPFKKRGQKTAPEIQPLDIYTDDMSGAGHSNAFEFPFVLTFENADYAAEAAKYYTPAWSLKQLESFFNSAMRSAATADTRRANPSVLQIHSAPDNSEIGKVDPDHVGQGSGAEAYSRRMEEKREIASIHFEYSEKMDELLTAAAEMRARITEMERKQNAQTDDLTGGPLYNTEPLAPTRKELIATGYTAVPAPIAEVPPHLVHSAELTREAAGESAGVPPALFGGSRGTINHNQTVLNTFQATIASRRHVLGPICEAMFFETYKYLIVAAVRKQAAAAASEKPKTRRPAAAAAEAAAEGDQPGALTLEQRAEVEGWLVRETKEAKALTEEKTMFEEYRLKLDFMGMADPMLTQELMNRRMVTAPVVCELVSGYSGLSIQNFDVDSLAREMKRQEDLADLAVEMDKVKLEILKAELKLKQAALEAAEAVAPQAPGTAGPQAAAAKSSSVSSTPAKNNPKVGEKRKTPAYEQVEGKSVDRKLAKFGAGKAMGTGKLSAKVHAPPPSGRGPHAVR
jgi:hypothetical protein